eukprot:CAMPEP_0170740640 /NCGR_PEP_ID=MMETSP0437-20130122/5789_1 /TAXON_ID=0 /ORGANISM="Sexangularia sp." /LENGTH=696 /DNA_ID=CAMNT_0011079149 /DNA_START=174 /DNA_END=2264 /DNA_ORIENTATION=-
MESGLRSWLSDPLTTLSQYVWGEEQPANASQTDGSASAPTEQASPRLLQSASARRSRPNSRRGGAVSGAWIRDDNSDISWRHTSADALPNDALGVAPVALPDVIRGSLVDPDAFPDTDDSSSASSAGSDVDQPASSDDLSTADFVLVNRTFTSTRTSTASSTMTSSSSTSYQQHNGGSSSWRSSSFCVRSESTLPLSTSTAGRRAATMTTTSTSSSTTTFSSSASSAAGTGSMASVPNLPPQYAMLRAATKMTSDIGNCISQPSKFGKQRFSLCSGSKGPKAMSSKCHASAAAAAARRIIGKLIGCSELDERRAEFEAPIYDLDEAMRALSEPIPRRVLVERGLSPNDVVDHFDEQYAFLERRQTCRFSAPDFTAARAVKNAMKNRYMDILPPDATRVRLSIRCNDPLSDYINANFIDGLADGSAKRYISTQGPTATTFGDFWRMVWEQGSHVIVMLTREIEKGYVKCNRYWPVRGCCCCYGGLKVRMVSESVLLDGEVAERCFEVACAQSGETRRVVQYQYTGWPDHGLPSSATGFLRVVQLASEAERSLDMDAVPGESDTARRTRLPPIIVHCSAGIGRSGTFIAVHASLERAASAPRPCYEPVLLVDQMRRQRVGMVQTREQFRFIYVALHAASGKWHPDATTNATLVDFFSGTSTSSCSSLEISKDSFFFPSSSDTSVTSDEESSSRSEMSE